MLRIHTDTSGLRRRTIATQRELQVGARRILNRAMGPVWAAAARNAPRDTGRYARGAAMAAADMGMVVTIPVVRRSRYAQQREDILDVQVTRMERELAEAEAAYIAHRGGGVRRERARKRVERARKRLERARRELAEYRAGGGTAVVIFAGKGRRLTTIRARLYGGRATYRVGAGFATLTARNREPHASIVEARRPIIRPGLARAGIELNRGVLIAARRGWARGGIG